MNKNEMRRQLQSRIDKTSLMIVKLEYQIELRKPKEKKYIQDYYKMNPKTQVILVPNDISTYGMRRDLTDLRQNQVLNKRLMAAITKNVKFDYEVK